MAGVGVLAKIESAGGVFVYLACKVLRGGLRARLWMSGFFGASRIPRQSHVLQRRGYVDDVLDDLGAQNTKREVHEVRHEVRNKTEKIREGVASWLRRNGSYSAATSGERRGRVRAAWWRGGGGNGGETTRRRRGLSRRRRCRFCVS